jgi:hypothetical protein
MPAPDYTGLFRFVYDWQSFIAGFVALGGGVLAYRAGITQAKATRKSAEGQIEAIKEQTAAVRQQNADLKRAEQRRLAQERSNVARVLWSCLGFVEDDVRRSSSRFGGDPDVELWEQAANSARRSIGKPNFDYLRERVGSFAREDIVPAFLGVEKIIDELRAEEGKISVGQLRARLDNLLDGVRNLRELAMVELDSARTILSENELPTHQ